VLLDLIKRLQREGVSILYVSHRLPEVQEISERVIALRDGKNSGEMRGPTFSRDALIQMIVGRELKDIYGYSPRPAGDVVLEVIDLQPSTHHEPCSLTLRAGEVVGVAGLIGSGRSELLESIAGLRAPVQGAVTLEGKSIPLTSAAAAGRAGIALVPESRKEQGIIAECSILENVNLSHLAVSTLVALRHTAEESEIARATIRDLQVRCSGEEQAVGKLSGGNQQKVVLGRCLAIKPRVLLLDEPTRGVDVGARREIYSLLFKLAEQGLAILFVSSELEEVLGIADRVLVMSEGAIRGEIPRERLSEHAIISLASPQERRAA
jgi:ribose transport system ATP-binding protein